MIGYSMHGSGTETVLLLHEWLGDSRNWGPVLPYLPDDRARYVCIDLRGYGRSKGIGGEYSLDEAVGDIFAILDRLQLQKVRVVGHSMSSLIAQRLLQLEPKLVEKLLLISPVPAAGFKMDTAAFEKLLAVATDDKCALEAIALRTGHRYGEGWLRKKLLIARESTGAVAMRGYARMFTGSDISRAARGITVPVHVLTGRYDLPIYRSDSVQQLFAPLYPNFSTAECLEAGHYGMLEAPVFVASQIEHFLLH